MSRVDAELLPARSLTSLATIAKPQLMDARRAVKDAKSGWGDLNHARAGVDAAKVALGERGPVWWDDGAPDFNRHMAKNTPYKEWADARKPK